MTPSELPFLFYFGEGANKRRIPLSHTPFTVSRCQYERAQSLQAPFQSLVRRIIEERHLLEDICQALSPTDDFVRHLYEIWRSCPKNEITLDVFRSDYMLHCARGRGGGQEGEVSTEERMQLKQVELNTISVSFAHLSSLLSRLPSAEPVVRHEADKSICNAFLQALNLYSSTSVAIMVISPTEANLQDQLGLIELMGGRMFRLTWEEIRQRVKRAEDQRSETQDPDMKANAKVNVNVNALSFTADDNNDGLVSRKGPIKLFLDDSSTPIGLVYYRTGYDPSQYAGHEDWQVRRILEASDAIKVPDVGAHLAGLKRVQQALTVPGVLERLLGEDLMTIRQLRSSFMRIYSLDPTVPQAKEAIKLALAQPTNWVVKPQREGGGHNIYGEAIVRFLQETPPTHLSNYILMERINAPVRPALLLRGSEGDPPRLEDCISELGIYGIQLCMHGRTLINEPVGHLVRTKRATQDEGGVVMGGACLANLLLVEPERTFDKS